MAKEELSVDLGTRIVDAHKNWKRYEATSKQLFGYDMADGREMWKTSEKQIFRQETSE